MLIVLFFENFFKLLYCDKMLLPDVLKITTNSYFKDFGSKQSEGIPGFYDWLRKAESDIIGVRFCYFDHHVYDSLLQKFPYIKIANDKKWIELLFENQEYDYAISKDHDFTDNYVHEPENGEYLFTFDLDHLTKHELNSLLKYCTVMDNEDFSKN